MLKRTWMVATIALLAGMIAGPALAEMEVELETWLIAGPVMVPYHTLDDGMDADPVAALIDSPPIDPLTFWPKPGDGFSARPGKRVTFREGEPRLPLLAVPDGIRLAVLTTYLHTPAWQQGELEVETEAPFVLFVNGEKIASRATMDEDAEEVDGEVTLDQGHANVVLVAVLPEGEDLNRWEINVEYDAPEDLDEAFLPTVTTDPVHPYDIIDYARHQSVSSLQLSPDGRYLALDLSQRDADDLAAYDRLEIWDTGSRDRIWSWDAEKGAGNLAWSPDGRTLLFVSGNGLFVYHRTDNRVERLGDKPENGSSFRWAGNNGLVYLKTLEAEESSDPYKVLWGLEDRWTGWRDDAALHHLSLEGLQDTRLLSMQYSFMNWTVSANGQSIVIVRSIPPEVRPYNTMEVLKYDLASGELATVFRDRFRLDWDLNIAMHPGGELLAFTAPSQKGMDAEEVTEFVNTNQIGLYTMDLGDGSIERIHPEFPMSVSNGAYRTGGSNDFVFREDGTLVFSATHLRRVHLCRWTPGSSMIEAQLLETPGFQKMSVATAARTSVLAYQGDMMDDFSNVYTWDIASNRGAMLVELSPELRALTEPTPRVEHYDYVNSDGVTIYGYLYYPLGYEEGGSYPLVVDTYGGVIGFADSFLWFSQLMANRGYFVYVPIPRGASGYGQAYADTHVNDWGQLTSRDMNEGVRHIVANVPGADGDRVGFASGSYGGFLAMYLLSMDPEHPDYYPYATAISNYGISNLASYWGMGWWGVLYSEMASAGSFPWNEPQWYIDQSPLYQADKITRPLLLLHGDADINVPVAESEQMFSALTVLDRPVTYVIFPDEGHGIVNDRQHYILSKRMHIEWFDKHLRDRPEAWDARMDGEFEK